MIDEPDCPGSIIASLHFPVSTRWSAAMANASWECATPGAGALVDSLRIRHSYNRRGQCTFHFLSYTNYTKLKKLFMCACVSACMCVCVPGYRSPGGGGTMGPFPLALALFGSWPGSEWFGHMVPSWCATSKPTRPRDQGLKPPNWEPQHIYSSDGLTAQSVHLS